jgi:hypothetical protein
VLVEIGVLTWEGVGGKRPVFMSRSASCRVEVGDFEKILWAGLYCGLWVMNCFCGSGLGGMR